MMYSYLNIFLVPIIKVPISNVVFYNYPKKKDLKNIQIRKII